MLMMVRDCMEYVVRNATKHLFAMPLKTDYLQPLKVMNLRGIVLNSHVDVNMSIVTIVTLHKS